MYARPLCAFSYSFKCFFFVGRFNSLKYMVWIADFHSTIRYSRRSKDHDKITFDGHLNNKHQNYVSYNFLNCYNETIWCNRKQLLYIYCTVWRWRVFLMRTFVSKCISRLEHNIMRWLQCHAWVNVTRIQNKKNKIMKNHFIIALHIYDVLAPFNRSHQ